MSTMSELDILRMEVHDLQNNHKIMREINALRDRSITSTLRAVEETLKVSKLQWYVNILFLTVFLFHSYLIYMLSS